MKAYKLGAIWSRGRHFRVQHIDQYRRTYDSGVSATFDQETSAGSGQLEKFTYYGHIQEILAVSYRSFEIHILDVKWYEVVKGGHRPSIKVAQNGFVVVDSKRLWTNRTDTFVFPDQCDQVHILLYSPNCFQCYTSERERETFFEIV